MGMMARSLATALFVLAAIVPATAGDDSPPEPEGYWNGPMLGPVPETIAGGTVVGTTALADLIRTNHPVLIDVAPAQRRPETGSTSSPWMPLPHRSIKDSVWIPGVGNGIMPETMAAYFRRRLQELTGNNPGRPIVLYCRPNCWMSWNAAKRAVAEGYRSVYWYPDGIEAWQTAGLPTEVKTSEGPEADTGLAVITKQGSDR